MRKKIKVLTISIFWVVMVFKLSWAEEKDAAGHELEKIIVTATKTEAYQAEVGSSSTVITSKDIRKTAKFTVKELLRDVPGVTVAQSGSFGGLTSIYLRGANPGYTLVLIDGIEVNDPIKSDSSFDFAHLTTDNIERIEVVRGPQSTLYGSDAMGGVINIVTKKGKGKPKWEISSEGGSHNTFRESANLTGSTKTLNYSLSASRLDSEGISKARGGAEKDGYKNTAISSKIGYKISDSSQLILVTRFTDAKTDLDDGAYDDDPNNIAWWRNIAGKIAFEQAINSIWDHKFSFSYSQTQRKYKDEPDSVDTADNTHNWFKSDTEKFEWQHNVCPVDWDTITGGFEYGEERGFGDGRKASDRFDRKTVDSTGYYLQNQFKFWENLFITPGLRVDNHELFGTETTYKISTAYSIPRIGARLKANWGTAFKAPSLYQLYHPTYGDSNLKPDESKSYDFGFGQSLWEGRFSFGTTYFYNDFKNMIDYDTATSRYKNIGRAETKGIETELSFRLIKDLTTAINYTYLKTKDKNTGKKLTKRPENQVGLNLNWAFLRKWNLNLGASYVGHNWDNSANTRNVKPYVKVDLSTSYELSDNFQVFGRIENFFDRRYEEVRGYATPGRSFYMGGKVTF
jgi:vitamin B12 transporter